MAVCDDDGGCSWCWCPRDGGDLARSGAGSDHDQIRTTATKVLDDCIIGKVATKQASTQSDSDIDGLQKMVVAQQGRFVTH
uniref:Uncharacterized protein n=1 Tax=Oryza sativa subsp. japonica TaxID=39947 RepID=Q6K921_ORYSJ|nr:hypothetical protein [Oryza sativa Japonica Group]